MSLAETPSFCGEGVVNVVEGLAHVAYVDVGAVAEEARDLVGDLGRRKVGVLSAQSLVLPTDLRVTNVRGAGAC